MTHLSSDHLRTFLAIHEAGSVTAGAARISRSQSAASLQIRALEAVIGTPLFRRHGRGVTLTEAGERLHPVARRVTHALDKTLADLRGVGLRGALRIGMPDDHSRTALAAVFAEFATRHPEVDLEVHCASDTGFGAALAAGTLDLAIHEVAAPGPNDRVLRQASLVWMCRRDSDLETRDILPVAVFDRACWWRDAALAALDQTGRRYRVVFTSESTVGVRAAVTAGIAVGLLNAAHPAPELRALPDLPPGPPSFLVQSRARQATGPVADAMQAAISRAFGTETDITTGET